MGRWERFWERVISVFKYIVACYMIIAGALTIFMPSDNTVNPKVSLVFGHKISIVIIAIAILASGVVLLIGKIKKNRVLTGRGLFAVYLCFFFATILNAIAYYGDPTTWVSNLIMAIIMGLLWLRWKFKTEYVNPHHFRQEALDLKER